MKCRPITFYGFWGWSICFALWCVPTAFPSFSSPSPRPALGAPQHPSSETPGRMRALEENWGRLMLHLAPPSLFSQHPHPPALTLLDFIYYQRKHWGEVPKLHVFNCMWIQLSAEVEFFGISEVSCTSHVLSQLVECLQPLVHMRTIIYIHLRETAKVSL